MVRCKDSSRLVTKSSAESEVTTLPSTVLSLMKEKKKIDIYMHGNQLIEVLNKYEASRVKANLTICSMQRLG